MKISKIIEDILDSANLTEIRKGDYVEQFGEIGLVNKVKGQVAYVKFDSNPRSFHPIMASSLKKSGKKHRGKDLYTESVNEILGDRETIVGYRWKDFQKNYLKLNPMYKIIHDKKEDVYYGLKKGTTKAHWKYFNDRSELYIDDKMVARKIMTGNAQKDIFEAFGHTGVPFPQTSPNEFAYLDFKKYVYKNRKSIKSKLSLVRDDKMFKAVELLWTMWSKRFAKEWSNIKGNSFGRELTKMMWKDNLIFDKSHHRITKIKGLNELLPYGDDPLDGKDG